MVGAFATLRGGRKGSRDDRIDVLLEEILHLTNESLVGLRESPLIGPEVHVTLVQDGSGIDSLIDEMYRYSAGSGVVK